MPRFGDSETINLDRTPMVVGKLYLVDTGDSESGIPRTPLIYWGNLANGKYFTDPDDSVQRKIVVPEGARIRVARRGGRSRKSSRSRRSRRRR